MDCNEFKTTVTQFIENDLSVIKKKAALEHETICPGCTSLRRNIQGLITKLKHLNPIKSSSGFDTALRQKIQQSNSQTPFTNFINAISESNSFRNYALVVAATLLIVTGGYMVVDNFDYAGEQKLPALSSPSYVDPAEDVDEPKEESISSDDAKSIGESETDEKAEENVQSGTESE